MSPAGQTQVRLGVDLIEHKKAQDFYQRHKDHLDKFFTVEEIFYIGRRSGAARRLAEVLAMKEAAFKASDKIWMGPRGFGKKLSEKNNSKMILIKSKKYVVAQCVGN